MKEHIPDVLVVKSIIYEEKFLKMIWATATIKVQNNTKHPMFKSHVKNQDEYENWNIIPFKTYMTLLNRQIKPLQLTDGFAYNLWSKCKSNWKSFILELY